jgi:hypothetical protein
MGVAFAYTVEKRTVFGDLRVVIGTFTPSGGSTGGDIKTGLSRIFHMGLQHSMNAVVASAPSCNETFPFAGGDVTIVTTADSTGTYMAFGL